MKLLAVFFLVFATPLMANSDNDVVPDAYNYCPNTPDGLRVWDLDHYAAGKAAQQWVGCAGENDFPQKGYLPEGWRDTKVKGDWMFRRSYFSHAGSPSLSLDELPNRTVSRQPFASGHPSASVRMGTRYNSMVIQNGLGSTDRTYIFERWVDENPR